MRRILFIHQSFPGQFIHLARRFVDLGNDVRSISIFNEQVQGVQSYVYQPARSSTPNIHPWLIDFESQLIRAQGVFAVAKQLVIEGYHPDLILVHPGWGEAIFLKEAWPQAKIALYCEFFYHAHGADVGFDPEFYDRSEDLGCKMQMKNLAANLSFPLANAALAPTQWQKSLFPEPFRSKITVIHEGIDTNILRPNPAATVNLKKQGLEFTLTHGDEVVTFVNRNLEPYRGYHIFMRALPEVMRARPNAHILIIGGDGHSYGPRAPEGQSWRNIFLQEVGQSLDINRVHFLGRLPYSDYVTILQLSAVHVYLTYPFVLGWSLLEAMSIGCSVVASDTDPVIEVVQHDVNGLLVDFFQPRELAKTITTLLASSTTRMRLGMAARECIRSKYDLQSQILPRQLAWIDELMASQN